MTLTKHASSLSPFMDLINHHECGTNVYALMLSLGLDFTNPSKIMHSS